MRCLIQNNDKDGQKKEWDNSDLIHVLCIKGHLAKQLPQLHIILFPSLFFLHRLVTFAHSLVHSLRQQWLLTEQPAEELKQASCSRVLVNNSLKYSHTWIKRAKNSKRGSKGNMSTLYKTRLTHLSVQSLPSVPWFFLHRSSVWNCSGNFLRRCFSN